MDYHRTPFSKYERAQIHGNADVYDYGKSTLDFGGCSFSCHVDNHDDCNDVSGRVSDGTSFPDCS
jgi:hypothetical protein